MEYFIFIIVVLAGVGGVWLYFVYSKYRRGKRINELTSSMNLLAKWSYAPDEWRKAVDEEFTWASSNDMPGQVFVSANAIYVRSDLRDHLIELGDNGRVVTHASFRGSAGNRLKLRVRWKEIKHGSDTGREVKYCKEDYRIPVPRGAEALATKVAAFFTTQIENNQVAYSNLVGEDEPISLFGRDDSF